VWYDDDRDVGSVLEPAGGPAAHDIMECAVLGLANDDQLGANFVGDVRELIGGVAELEEELGRNARGA
jgi:hypothetical protein